MDTKADHGDEELRHHEAHKDDNRQVIQLGVPDTIIQDVEVDYSVFWGSRQMGCHHPRVLEE